ncbi:threonine--tRNA ligase [Acetivibrio mesophilus]|uniref:Threonine--tRNA ligase n=1 Tax=Acetivibrio mesophilus TaxID=2487273 RepID=A0A4Q0I6S7_9FIRM|nr:threonine--tRNA ligase [Acetivibrio mesophilus]ODM24994.1 threonine--tRNA ligase [Clostridium sp. Bc-iso-3]RXE60008.1 threonine--tRNA ligase [Acetivibrio mesophilus]HHV29405.1 threonine--tRNA ligase [Clostridium sp.]
MIKVTLKDGSVKEYDKGITVKEVAESISAGLARVALAGEVNGQVKDLDYRLEDDCVLSLLTFDDDGGKHAYRHTSSHIMAQAVKRLYPEAKLAIGPSIENGFYYDFDVEKPFSVEELENIEKEMQKIIKEDLKLERFTLPRDEAIKFMEERNEPYKVELIRDLPEGETISFYKQGEFVDLCAGPHIESTGKVKAFKLMSVAGAYWRGNEKNKMLQRIYGTSFNKKSELDAYITRIEEAKKRDHRKLGRELDLFDIYEEGPGFPFFMPKGMVLRNTLEEYWREEHNKAGYQEIRTPIILNEELWHRSGHWDHYKENMYFTKIDEGDYAIKPMNCPGGMLVYKRKLHSYRDLPQRMAELGLVHRHELSGALHGLMRVRCFTQDDAHIFMTPDQIESEVVAVINLIDDFYKVFGFKYHVELSTRPENSMGSDEDWERATNALKNALEQKGINYKINEGDGAFYGPKIDFHLEDSIGRTWQCGTIQLDFQMPERFDLTYVGADGEKHRPVMIHRVVFGSIERFIAILTEHFAGAFPVWLSPVQVKILPIVEKQHEYVDEIKRALEEKGIRVEVDLRNEKIGYKIREAQLEKVPYMLVIGDREMENRAVAVRSRKDGDLGSMPLEDFVNKIVEAVKNKEN